MYDIGSFYEAASVEDAIRKLQEWPDAEIISGGSDVLIKIREGKLAGRSLVSIHNIAVLKGVTMEEDGTIVIGPGTSFSHITAHPLVQQHIPMLGYAVDQVGGPRSAISAPLEAMSATVSPVRTVRHLCLPIMRFWN